MLAIENTIAVIVNLIQDINKIQHFQTFISVYLTMLHKFNMYHLHNAAAKPNVTKKKIVNFEKDLSMFRIYYLIKDQNCY